MDQRKIIHVDMDAFFVSVEIRDNPELANKPVAVGGSVNSRGVLSTCNYIARQYGVGSAMPTGLALKKCPNLVIVPGRMDVYKKTSTKIREIFERYTDIIEPLSLDEAYLDVSKCKLFEGSATLIAKDICDSIYKELNLTASAGVAPIKFIAKIASDINKPNGICVITPDQVQGFVEDMELGKIPGVGKVTLEKLNKLSLYKGKDVKCYDRVSLLRNFGKFGQSLWEKCHGIDNRKIETSRVRKSVGVETTFSSDIFTEQECHSVIERLYSSLLSRLEKASPEKKIIKQGVKLKFDDFKQTTVEHKKNSLDKKFFYELLQEALERKKGRGIRLIGLTVGLDIEQKNKEQMNFDW
jgi:DNA polymerase-4